MDSYIIKKKYISCGKHVLKIDDNMPGLILIGTKKHVTTWYVDYINYTHEYDGYKIKPTNKKKLYNAIPISINESIEYTDIYWVATSYIKLDIS